MPPANNNTADAILSKLGEKMPEVLEPVQEIQRFPTGIFPLDLILGGGLPIGKCTQFHGPESSGKTTVTYMAMRSYQQLYPDHKIVFVDVEDSFDPEWVSKFKIDPDSILVVRPTYAEQAIDVSEALANTDDVELMVFDSLGALFTQKEIENDASWTKVSGNAVQVMKLMNKIHAAQMNRRHDKVPFTFIAINQIRQEVGKMFGNPEKYPGGHTLKHLLSFVIRLWSKPEIDKSIDPKKPSWRLMTAAIHKYKGRIIANDVQFKLGIHPKCPNGVGSVDDWNLLLGYLKNSGALVKVGAKWQLFGQFEYDKQDDLKQQYANDLPFALSVQQGLIQALLLADAE